MSKQFDIAFKTTAWFETGDQMFTCVCGNFDGMGISFGPRQNNLGQGTLQPLLKAVEAAQPGVLSLCFGVLYPALQSILSQPTVDGQTKTAIMFANDGSNRLKPDWKRAFQSLGGQTAMQRVFMDDALGSAAAVEELATWMALGCQKTIRTFCVAFDIVTQNGNISTPLRLLLTAIRPLLKPFKRKDTDWLEFLCWARAMWTDFRGNAEFSQNVLARKLLILHGHGKFGGAYVDLDQKFGITDEVY